MWSTYLNQNLSMQILVFLDKDKGHLWLLGYCSNILNLLWSYKYKWSQPYKCGLGTEWYLVAQQETNMAVRLVVST